MHIRTYINTYHILINTHRYLHTCTVIHKHLIYMIHAQNTSHIIIPSASIGYFAIGMTFRSKGSFTSPDIKIVTISCPLDSRAVNDLSLNVMSTPLDWPTESTWVDSTNKHTARFLE